MTVWNVFSLCGGLGLFLYGMSMMSEGFEKVAGDRLRSWLSFLTNRKIVGVLVGVGATAIIQSSSATTVMLVGFVNAGVMTLTQAMNVTMGASIGTTITGIIVAFKLSAIAPLFVLAGVIMTSFIKNARIKRMGLIVLGFGVLFLGMGLMGDALKPLADSQLFRDIILSMKNPFVGLLVGMAITAVIQSSSAFTGILITLAAQGMISLDEAIPLVIGSSIGTCATALIACLGTSVAAKRVAVSHLFYKVMGALIFIVAFQFIPVSRWIQELFGEVEWQVAAFNTVFTMCTCLVLYPLAGWFVSITERIMPEKDAEETEERALKYFDASVLNTPTLVVPQLLKETNRMVEMARKNMVIALCAIQEKSTTKAEKLNKREDIINYLTHEMTHQLVVASEVVLSPNDRRTMMELLHIVSDVERIADHAQNIMEQAEIIKEHKLSLSDTATTGIKTLGDAALASLDICTQAYFAKDETLYDDAEQAEKKVDALEETLKDQHMERLRKGNCEPMMSMVYTDILSDLERISDHAYNFITAIYDSEKTVL